MEWSIKTNGHEPFFPFKNRLSQSYDPYSSASINVKTGSPDPADFATTRPLIHWQVLAIRAMFGRPLAYYAVKAVSGCTKIRQNLPAVAYRAKSLGKSHCDGRDFATVAPTIAQITTVGKVEAESWQNWLNLDNQFLHRWMWYRTLWTVALRRPIFKPKKGPCLLI
jgi:hypothetical protein